MLDFGENINGLVKKLLGKLAIEVSCLSSCWQALSALCPYIYMTTQSSFTLPIQGKLIN